MLVSKQSILNVIEFLVATIFFTIGSLIYTPVFIVYYMGYILTLVFMRMNNKDIIDYRNTVSIFTSTLILGFILAFAVNYDFLENRTTFRYPDQMHFYESAANLAYSSSIKEFMISVFLYTQYHVVYMLFGFVAWIDYFFSGSVNFLSLLYNVVYTTALIPVFLYHIVKLYLPNRFSFKSSLYYGLMTPVMAYSGYLLRDIHITLAIMIVLFWIVRKVRIDRIIGIFILMVLVGSMRTSNLLLIAAMLMIYLLKGNMSKTKKKIVMFFTIVAVLIASGKLIETMSMTSDRLEGYVEFTSNAVDELGGKSKWLHSLPPVIKETGIAVSALFSFPFGSVALKLASTPSQFVMAFYDMITDIGWLLIFVGLIYFFFPILTKVKIKDNKAFLYLIILFVLYLYLNTFNMVFRRLLCVFPFVYIPFLMVLHEAPPLKKHRYKIILISSTSVLFILTLLTII